MKKFLAYLFVFYLGGIAANSWMMPFSLYPMLTWPLYTCKFWLMVAGVIDVPPC
jgi:hypothetical protein